MSSILPTLHRQAAKEVVVQPESLRATAYPNTGSGGRLLHLRVSESTELLGSAQRHTLPDGWEGLIAVSESLQTCGGRLRVQPLSVFIQQIERRNNEQRARLTEREFAPLR